VSLNLLKLHLQNRIEGRPSHKRDEFALSAVCAENLLLRNQELHKSRANFKLSNR